MNQEMRRGTFLVAVLLVAGCGGVSRSDYVAGKQAIVKSLPVFPGAVKMGEDSMGSNSSGYRTLVFYRVRRGTTGAAVLRFYERQLQRRGWQARGKPLEEDFTRDKAAVSLFFVLGPAPPVRPGQPIGRAYDIAVNYRGAARG
jgi:hypothetical protein